jgi:hypothetical protein
MKRGKWREKTHCLNQCSVVARMRRKYKLLLKFQGTFFVQYPSRHATHCTNYSSLKPTVSDTVKLLRSIRDSNVHYRVHKSLPVTGTRWVHSALFNTPLPDSLNSIVPFTSRSFRLFLPIRFPAKLCMHVTWPSHCILFDSSIVVIFRKEHVLINLKYLKSTRVRFNNVKVLFYMKEERLLGAAQLART